MTSKIEIRRLRKSDEGAIEDLLVNDVYRWRPWIFVCLKHGLFSIFPIQIALTCVALLVIGSTLGQFSTALWVVLASLSLVCVASLLKMGFVIRFVRNYPEFAAKNLTEKYSEEGCAFFVAELDGRIVGCVGVKKRDQEEADLYRMAISFYCQGLGVGRKLVRSATDFASQGGYRRLVLRTSHIIQAHLFYLKVGFRIRDVKTYWFFKILPARIYEMVYELTKED